MHVAAVRKPGGPGNLIIEERSDPTPLAGELLMRVHANSLNYHDLAVVMGLIPCDDGRIPMSDGAGEVVAVGEGVTQFAVGDHVVSTFFPDWQSGGPQSADFTSVPGDGIDGFAAGLVAVPEGGVTPMPRGYSFREAATLPCAALTAWRGMFVENNVKPGDWVLTQGTGGVSVFALQFAKAAGAQVIATSSSDEKLERLTTLGADHTINYVSTPDWGRRALELTGGRGVDEVVEIGGPGTMAQSVAACRIGGHISLIGVLTGISGEVPTAAIFAKNITVSGITVGSRQHQLDMTAAIEACDIKPVLDQDFPLDRIADAFMHQASGAHFGKITISL